MAEARAAVIPKPALMRAGFEIDTNVKKAQVSMTRAGFVLYIPHPRFLLRNLKKGVFSLWSDIGDACMPLYPSLVTAIVSVASLVVAYSPKDSWQRSGRFAQLLWKIDSCVPFTKYFPVKYRVFYLTFNTSVAVMLSFTYTQRFILRRLLQYHGWLYERKTKSLATKVWGAMLRTLFVGRIHKKTVAYQNSLPTLPVPSIQDTVDRYLRGIKVCCSETEFKELQVKSNAFLQQEGPMLQRYLRLKWLVSENYVSDWWLKYVYLRGRESLCINSNWYGIMFADFKPTTFQASRAAAVVRNLVKVKRQMDQETFEPQVIAGFVPMCMKQYEYAFSTTRVPGREIDVLEKHDPAASRHVAVIHKGRFFKLPVFSPKSNNPLSALQLEAAIEGILNSGTAADPNELYIPSLTAANRTEWADVRDEHFMKDPFNRHSLRVIESALFVLCLDDEPTGATLSDQGKSYLMGNGNNRWSDKSFCVIIDKNGKCGFHCEHAWGDAPTLAHVIECISTSDEFQRDYDEHGRIKATAEDIEKKQKGVFSVYPAERVRFHVTEDLRIATENAFKTYRTQIANLDLYVANYAKYGKRLCKKSKCSPDGWIQMALQLAYYRNQGRFDQTYESAMTRLFLNGRTETIRSLCPEAAEFVLAMENKDMPKEKRAELLRKACDNHQQTYLDAMVGKGVDRHMFALYVVSVGKQIDSPFLQAVLGKKWKLSTSQVPTRQLDKKLHHPDEDKFHTPNGGFGPVADDGYGVSYCVWGEDMFYFNVSSKFSCDKTSSQKFHNEICRALDDLGALFAE